MIDVQGGRDRDNNNVWVHRNNGSKAQKWDVVYLDEAAKYFDGRSVMVGGFSTGKQFRILSSMNRNMALTLRGTGFVLATRDNSASQVFKYDQKVGNIVTHDDLNKALSIGNNGKSREVKLENNANDWWKNFVLERDGHLKNQRNVFIQVQGNRPRESAKIIVNRRTNNRSQKWIIEYLEHDLEKNELKEERAFRIVSKLRGKRLLTRSGDKLVIRDRNNGDSNQIWLLDRNTKTIEPKAERSVAIDIGQRGHNRNLEIDPSQAKLWSQQFRVQGDYLVNERGLVFDIAGGRDRNNQNVLVWKKHRGMNQKWEIEYV